MNRNTNNDQRGNDGNLYKAWRTVMKGGVITFDNIKYQSDDLKDYIRERVFVLFGGNSPWASYPIHIFKDYNQRFKITTINNPSPYIANGIESDLNANGETNGFDF